MTVAQYAADFLVKHGTTDAFGIPGGVILDFIYALDDCVGITPHLSYHEQCAGFAACGYAQESGKLGVAYATRGPGFTNLISAIADAYCDSIPVLFIIGHTSIKLHPNMRVMADQEFDTCSMVAHITKFADKVESAEQLVDSLDKSYNIAMDGRKGPVFLDIASSIFKEQIAEPSEKIIDAENNSKDYSSIITEAIRNAKRPVVLLGDGINQVNKESEFISFIEKADIPCVSSRYSHNIGNKTNLYYGYLGSHGIRAANFVMSKSDLIISIGNRLHYPIKSESFSKIMNNVRVIRFDIDESEFERNVPGSECYNVNIASMLDSLALSNTNYNIQSEWIETCNTIKNELKDTDVNDAVITIADILKSISCNVVISSDVGNNEFWLSRACILTGIKNRVLYSKSFGALGCGLGKAIGAYYVSHQPVVCFVGDQGLQINIQELMFISQHKLPIAVVILNNQSSGMIKDRETETKKNKYLHTTKDSGYDSPNFKYIAKAYGLEYKNISSASDINGIFADIHEPMVINVKIDEDDVLTPSLPKGEPFQNLFPELEKEKYNYLNSL